MTNKEFKPYTARQEKFGTWLINRLGRLQTSVYEFTGGRAWNTFLGAPVAILTTLGRKSGIERKVPLLYLKHKDQVIMTASKGGMSGLPLWYYNVMAAPTVQIQIGAEKQTYTPREATPAEEEALWPELEQMYPDYREYRARTAGVRHIPILIFTPVGR